MNGEVELATMGQLSALLGLCILFFPFNRHRCLLHQISQTQIMLSEDGSIRFQMPDTNTKASTLTAFQLRFFSYKSQKNKFILWVRDGELDRFF